MVEFAYFKRVLEKEKKKRRRRDSEESIGGDEQNEKKKKRSKRTSGEQDPYDFESDDDSHIDEAAKRVTRSQTKTTDSSQPDSDQTETPAKSETSATITEERYVQIVFILLFVGCWICDI